MADLVSITMERQDAADLAVALESLQHESEIWAAYDPLIRGSAALRNALNVEDVFEATDRETERRA